MMKSWPYINNFILIIKCKNLVALAWIIYKTKSVVNEPPITNVTIKFQEWMAVTESIVYYFIKITHGSVAYEATNNVWEFMD